jgi:two-component system, cell cycle response regulator DivK
VSPADPPLVLVVDHFEESREIYAMYLRHVGFRVAVAADSISGLELAMELRPAVVVLDVTMSRLDLWRLCRLLKSDPLSRNIFVVAVTDYATEASAAGAHAAGCDSYLMKPCALDELEREIRRLLRLRSA